MNECATEMSARESHRIFQIRVRVSPEDIDEMDHVNNAVYLRWVQEAAVAHWRAAASAEMQADTLWVVLRHEIDYKSAALLGDEFIVTTWVGGATRITFERHTEITRADDDEAERVIVAQARTLWCPIDAQSRRPKRVSSDIRNYFSIEPLNS